MGSWSTQFHTTLQQTEIQECKIQKLIKRKRKNPVCQKIMRKLFEVILLSAGRRRPSCPPQDTFLGQRSWGFYRQRPLLREQGLSVNSSCCCEGQGFSSADPDKDKDIRSAVLCFMQHEAPCRRLPDCDILFYGSYSLSTVNIFAVFFYISFIYD